MDALTLLVMYLVPLAGLVWLYSVNPGYALIGVVVIGVAIGIGGILP